MHRSWYRIALIIALASAAAAPSRTDEPIGIGFSMALTGGGASNGKVALIATDYARIVLAVQATERHVVQADHRPAEYLGLEADLADGAEQSDRIVRIGGDVEDVGIGYPL